MTHRYYGSTIAVFLVIMVVSSSFAQDAEIPLGSPMPGQDIQLADGMGKTATLGALSKGKSLAVVFWSNRCPWTSKYEDRIKLLYNDLSASDNVFVLINANDGAAFPDENAAASAKYLKDTGIAAHYLTDTGSRLARAFGATRTPHVFVFDKNATLVYVGAIDDSPGDPGRVQKEYLREALVAVGAGRRIDSPQTKAFGCMIKLVQ